MQQQGAKMIEQQGVTMIEQAATSHLLSSLCGPEIFLLILSTAGIIAVAAMTFWRIWRDR